MALARDADGFTIYEPSGSTGIGTAGWQDGYNEGPPASDVTMIIFASTSEGMDEDDYWFTISAGSAPVGSTYTNNGQTFTVVAECDGGTLLKTNGTGAPAASGTLTKASEPVGTDNWLVDADATLTFSAVAATFDPDIQGSSAQPYRTLMQIKGLMRNGSPDWCLMRYDDVFEDQYFTDDGDVDSMYAYGASEDEPMVFGSYEPTASAVGGWPEINPGFAYGLRPVIDTTRYVVNFPGTLEATPNANFVHLVGFATYTRGADPNSPWFMGVEQSFTVDTGTNVLTLPDSYVTNTYFEDAWPVFFINNGGTLPTGILPVDPLDPAPRTYYLEQLTATTFKINTVRELTALRWACWVTDENPLIPADRLSTGANINQNWATEVVPGEAVTGFGIPVDTTVVSVTGGLGHRGVIVNEGSNIVDCPDWNANDLSIGQEVLSANIAPSGWPDSQEDPTFVESIIDVHHFTVMDINGNPRISDGTGFGLMYTCSFITLSNDVTSETQAAPTITPTPGSAVDITSAGSGAFRIVSGIAWAGQGLNYQITSSSQTEGAIHLQLEDLWLRYSGNNMNFDGQNGSTDITIRRVVSQHAYAQCMHGFGCPDRFRVEQCLFDHGGWIDGYEYGSSARNGSGSALAHALYLSGSELNVPGNLHQDPFINNVISQGTTDAQMRTGGQVYNCLVMNMPAGFIFGTTEEWTSTVNSRGHEIAYSVFTDPTFLGIGGGGYGIVHVGASVSGETLYNEADINIYKCIFSYQGGGDGIAFPADQAAPAIVTANGYPTGDGVMFVEDSIVWGFQAIGKFSPAEAEDENLTNVIQSPSRSDAVRIAQGWSEEGVSRSIASYITNILQLDYGAAVPSEYLAALMAGQRKGNWNRLLEAASVNDYFRQGFNMTMLDSAYAEQFPGTYQRVQLIVSPL